MTETQQDPGGDRGDGASQYRHRTPPRTTVGRMLRDDRDALKLRQEDVAAALGFTQSKLSAYERGAVREPPPERLVALARHYGQPESRYVSELAWSRGVRLALGTPPPGSLTIEHPRAGLAELIDAVNVLSPTEFGELLQTALDMSEAKQRSGRE